MIDYKVEVNEVFKGEQKDIILKAQNWDMVKELVKEASVGCHKVRVYGVGIDATFSNGKLVIERTGQPVGVKY